MKPAIKQVGWIFKRGDEWIYHNWVFDPPAVAPAGYSLNELQEIFARHKEWDCPLGRVPSREAVETIWEEVKNDDSHNPE